MKLDKILFLGPDGYESFLQKRLSEFKIVKAQSLKEVEFHINDALVVFDAYMKVPFKSQLLEKANNLKLFITATTGASHIDHISLEKRNIPLLTLKGQHDIINGLTPAAELSWLLLMSVARKLPAAREEVLAGEWDRNKFPGTMLKGKTLGLIGCGRIGLWMARYANAFGMKVLGFDPIQMPDTQLFENCSLEHLISSSDFISIHIPFNEENRNFLSADMFAEMKKGVFIINTSRGEVIDEEALLNGLETGNIAGAGLDVLQSEPDIDNDPLVRYARKNTNLIITPHIGGFSPDALEVVLDFSCKRIKDFFAHEC